MAVAAAGWVGFTSPGDYAAPEFPPHPRHHRRRDREGLHQRRPARRHQDDRETAATTKRNRADDRPHENRRPPDPMPAQGNDRRRALRGAVRLRSQHPHDPAPPEGHFAPARLADRTTPRVHAPRRSPSGTASRRLTSLFRMNHLMTCRLAGGLALRRRKAGPSPCRAFVCLERTTG